MHLILSVLLTATILIALIFFLWEKKLSFLENAIVFMVIAIITRNYNTIMAMVLHLFKNTESHQLFVGLLLHREIILPLLVLLFINAVLSFDSWKQRAALFLLIMVTLVGLDLFLVHFKIIRYIKWNVYFACFVNLSYLCIGLGLTFLLNYLKKQEFVKHDNRL
jgi:hypothetical protein